MLNNIMALFPDYQALYNQVKALTAKQICYSDRIFDFLVPYLEKALWNFIIDKKRKGKGPKPKLENINNFLKSFFFVLDNGCKIKSIVKPFKISKATYYRFMHILRESNMLELFHKELLAPYNKTTLGLLDSTHIRSVDGSEGTAYGYKEVSKKAVKMTLVTSASKVILLSGLNPDNVADSTGFKQLAMKNPSDTPMTILADSSYTGRDFKTSCKANRYKIISPQKRFTFGASEAPSPYEALLLKRHRPKVEHVFSQLKRFRAIQVKYNKRIWAFWLLLQLAILIISILNGIILGGLKRPIRVVLSRKNC